MTNPAVTVVITTYNRGEELVAAVKSCLQQTVPCEVLVYDDASSDPIDTRLSECPPQVKVIRSPARVGYIALRNRGFREASGDIVVSIDDDAYLTSPQTLERIIELFRHYPQAAAFALPYVEPFSNRETMSPLPVGTQMRNYIGCAHAVRRQVVLDLGVYPELLVHQGEERDLTIRMIDAGYDILFADTPPIVHLYSPKRDQSRLSYYGYRNTILFCWMRVPFPQCLISAIAHTFSLLRYQFRWGALRLRIRALAAGWFGLIWYWSSRAAVSGETYRRYRRYETHGPMSLQDQTVLVPPSPVGNTSGHLHSRAQ